MRGLMNGANGDLASGGIFGGIKAPTYSAKTRIARLKRGCSIPYTGVKPGFESVLVKKR